MFTKEVTAFGKRMTIGCDGKCEKAFGITGRPFIQLSEDPDDVCYLSDNEVGLAPETGKTKIISEGNDLKPFNKDSDQVLNKWCFRACERSTRADTKETLVLPNWNERVYNIPRK